MMQQAQQMMSNPAMMQQAASQMNNMSKDDLNNQMNQMKNMPMPAAPAAPAPPPSATQKLKGSPMAVPEEVTTARSHIHSIESRRISHVRDWCCR